MTTTYELYTNENGTPKAVEGKAPAILERVEALEGTFDNGVVTSVNGQTGDVTVDVGVTSVNGNTGDITPEQTGCLPLGGGKLTGKITSSSERVLDSTNANGLFIVADSSVTSTKTGCISVFPVGHSQSNRAGGFQLVASDGTNNKTLTGSYVNGLKWDGKEVERVNAAGKGWIRYENGIQICWGYTSLGTSETTVTFPAAFSSNSNTSLAVASATQTTYMVYIPPGSFTTFKGKMSVSGAIRYIAIGLWK